MTVAELIIQLQALKEQDAPVVTIDDWGSREITDIYVRHYPRRKKNKAEVEIQ